MITPTTYFCKFDQSFQPALIRRAASDGPRPLVVALHTWSCDSKNCGDAYSMAAEKWDWHFIYPEFRGPNWNVEGCGSDLVVSDLEDAVAFMKSICNVDDTRVYLTGGSGGGHCSLLLAARRPDLWTAVSSWCPISDVAAWHAQCRETRYSGYSDHIEKSCGGDPAVSEAAAFQCRLRSPLTWLANARRAGLPVDISTGIHDGHTGSVPVSQSFNAFNILADEADRFSAEEINFMEKEERIFPGLEYKDTDPAFHVDYPVLLRRQSASTRLTIFEGGHNIFPAVSFEWLSRQVKGKTADWNNGEKVYAEDGELSK